MSSFPKNAALATAFRRVNTPYYSETDLENIFVVIEMRLKSEIIQKIAYHPDLLKTRFARRLSKQERETLDPAKVLQIADILKNLAHPTEGAFMRKMPDDEENFAFVDRTRDTFEIFLDDRRSAARTEDERQNLEIMSFLVESLSLSGKLSRVVEKSPYDPDLKVSFKDFTRLLKANNILYDYAAKFVLLNDRIGPLLALLEGITVGTDEEREKAGRSAIEVLSAAVRVLFEKPKIDGRKLKHKVEMLADGERKVQISLEAAAIGLAKDFVKRNHRLPTKLELSNELEGKFPDCKGWLPGGSNWTRLWSDAGLVDLPHGEHGARYT